MERTSTASTRLVLLIIAVSMAFHIVRAATRDVTPSEAWNYDRYVGLSWSESLRQFDVNNHVINTLLERISTKRFHLTELSLRLPALLGGLLYMWASFRLCRRWFQGAALVLAFSVMTFNPLIVDALSEARGYGIGLALWMLALDLFLQCLEGVNPSKLNQAAMYLALCVAASVSFIVPVFGLVAVFSFVQRKQFSRDLYLPMLVFLFVLLAIPMNRLILRDLAQGQNSLPLLVWFGMAALAAIALLVHRTRDQAAVLCGGTGLAAMLIVLAAHRVLRMPYPDRGAIYFVPLATLTILTALRRYPRAVVLASAICLVIYAAQFPAGAYREGREFAGSREVAKTLRAEVRQRPARIASSLELEPVLNYYRTRYRQGNWERIPRKPLSEGYDYYVLTIADASWVDRLGLRVIRRTPGIILAAR